MKRFVLLTFLLLASYISFGQVFKVDTLLHGSNPTNRLNFVILPDGYTATQQARAGADGKVLTSYLMNTWPFSQYINYFNVYLVHVISVDSGAKHPHTATDCPPLTTQPIANPNTFFGSTFDYDGIHRFLMPSRDPDTVLMKNFSWYKSSYTTFNVLPVIIVNTLYYGGAAEGNVAVTSRNASNFEIVCHELGHSLAGLGDEYSYTGCGGIEEWNDTQDTGHLTCRWHLWFDNNRPSPTGAQQDAGDACTTCTGLYVGANYCPVNWYRPQANCKMRALGYPYCSICLERFVYAFNYYVNPIDAYSPAASVVSLTASQSQTFTIKTVRTVKNSLRVQWLLDNILFSGADSVIMNNTLKAGTHKLSVSVYDTTCMARVALTTYTHSWTFTTTGTALPPCMPLHQIQVLACQIGYAGNHIQTRDYSCPAAIWAAWKDSVNTCVVIPPPPQIIPVTTKIWVAVDFVSGTMRRIALEWVPVAGATNYNVYIDGLLIVKGASQPVNDSTPGAIFTISPGNHSATIVTVTQAGNSLQSLPYQFILK